MNNEKIEAEQNINKTNKVEIDIKKYDDPTGMAAKNLDWGLWLANHKRQIKKIITII